MKTSRQVLGKWGENLAESYLSQLGYLILERNARTPYGEIDLVTQQLSPHADPSIEVSASPPSVTVFVEVKTRSSMAFGLPEEAITESKKAHMLAAAQAYLQLHPELDGDWRVDVISIIRTGISSEPVVTHFENALA